MPSKGIILTQPEIINSHSHIITVKQKHTVMKKKKRTPSRGKTANTKRMTMISSRAKKIRKGGEVWTNAIKRASNQLKREGKL